MFKNPIVKDGIKALAIFLLPFLLYLHLFFDDIPLSESFLSLLDSGCDHKFLESEWVYHFLSRLQILLLLLIWRTTLNLKFRIGQNIIVFWLLQQLCTLFLLDLLNNLILIKLLSFISFSIYFIYKLSGYQKSNIDLHKKILLYNTLLFCIPLFAELSFLLPKGKTSIDIIYLTIDSYGFKDLYQFSFVILNKLAILLIYLIWFFTEKNWWRYAILAPILVTGNQIINVFNTTSESMDELELYQSGPFLLTILIALLLLAQAADNQERIKTFLRLQYQNIEHAVEQRFGKQQQNIEEKKQRLATKKDLSKKELAALKRELEEELKNLT